MIAVFPSLISANLLRLQEEIEHLESSCAGFHLDVMDFHFVPNLTWGPTFINQIRQVTKQQLWVHLMVEFPEKYIDRLELYPGDIVSVHIESPSKLNFPELINVIQQRNFIASVAINPHTPLEAIITCPVILEHVLLMSVNPGFSGQTFLPHTFDRLKALNLFKQAHNLSFTIALDGGITQEISKKLIELGAEQLAVASAVFDSPDPLMALQSFTNI